MKMKKLFTLLCSVAFVLVAGYGCDTPDQEPQPSPQLEVTPNNISGSWKLSLWNDAEIPENSYVYIDFVRSDRTYTLFQNIDTFDKRTITGRYFIYTDEELGAAVLRGEYDYGNGEWNHRYIVASLTAEQMILIPTDTQTEEFVYDREEIPSEISSR